MPAATATATAAHLHLRRIVHNLFRVGLRVAGHPDAKVVPVLLPDVAHQVQRAAEAALHHLKVLLALWRVTAQCQDVLDTSLAHL